VYRGCAYSRYAVVMASNETPQRVIRVDKETWDAYGELCAEKGVARSADVRMYIKREVAEWRRQQHDPAAAHNRLPQNPARDS
jgi:hypothetical protein